MLHIPSFMERAEELKEKGIEQLVCVSVNDVFVMDAWGKSLGADDILMVVRAFNVAAVLFRIRMTNIGTE